MWQYEIIIAVSIAVVGWVITHLFNITANRKLLLHQIHNEARNEIIKALGEYQSWLGEISFPLHTRAALVPIGFGSWRQLADHINEVHEKYKSDWIFVLENYEILFPETRCARQEMVVRQIEITNYIGDLVKTLLSTSEAQRNSSVEIIRNKIEFIEDQSALVEDLKIYIQNKTLHEITGSTIPEREPLDPKVPKMVLEDGMLKIVQEAEAGGMEGR